MTVGIEGVLSMAETKFRLITRADFDGVVCGALFNELDMIDDIVFAEPSDMQQGRVPVSEKNITTNLPYVEGVHLCLDHHASELERVGERDNLINDPDAPSAARVVYRHFGGKKAFPKISDELLAAVDQADSAQYSEEDILAPEKWTLLNFVIDPRTALEALGGYSIAQNALLYDLMTYCRHNPIDEILAQPDVQERVAAYQYQNEFAELQIIHCSRMHGKLLVVDFRQEEFIYPCNRFLVYALNPECNISIHLLKDYRQQNPLCRRKIRTRPIVQIRYRFLVAGIRWRRPCCGRGLHRARRRSRRGFAEIDPTHNRRQLRQRP